jgi:hypothetical protein
MLTMITQHDILVIMIRTQISLTAAEYALAKKDAKKQGISVAEYFRRALRLLLPRQEKNPWMAFAGMVSSGDAQASQKIDEVVYGQKD